MTSAAARQARHRARQRDGRVVLLVEADEDALTVKLIEAGFLRIEDAEDRQALQAALQRVVEIWAEAS